jgi:hypothetical protein
LASARSIPALDCFLETNVGETNMWTCKYCSHEVADDRLDEYPNCGTGRNWIPPTEIQSVAADSEAAETLPTSKAPPFSDTATGFLRIIAFAVAIIGVIAGIIILTNAPSAPSDIAVRFRSDDLPTQIQSANRMLYSAVGWAQIIGGITTGVFLYVVAGIGDTVLDLWRAQQNK